MTRQNNNELWNSLMAGRDINQYYVQRDIGGTLLNEVPKPDANYIERKKEEEKINHAIKENSVIQVYGISGNGKTELVKKVVSQTKDFDCFWVSCEKSKGISLTSVCGISGQNHNLLHRIAESRCLVILDNAFCGLNQVIAEFLRVNNYGSKLIIISQEKTVNPDVTEKIFIDLMLKEEAQQVFTENIFQNEEFWFLFGKLEYHPMTLKLIKTYLLENDNGMVVHDFLNTERLVNLRDSELTDSQEICKKILGDYYDQKSDVCILLGQMNSNCLESEFLKSCIFSEVSELTKLGFLKAEEEFYFIHDIILNSMKALANETGQAEKLVYCNEIMDYLKKENENRTLGFYTFFALHQCFLKDVFQRCENRQMKILIYNSLLLFANQKDKELHIQNMDALLKDDDLTSYYSIKLFIEKLEFWIHLAKREEKRNRNEESITCLKRLLEFNKDTNCRLLIIFHIGKFYSWNHEYEKAEKLFQNVLAINANEPSAQLQLLRIYRQYISKNRKNDCNVEIEEGLQKRVSKILSQIEYTKIPVAIYLEILNLIKNQPLNSNENLTSCLWKPFEYFKKVVMLYAQTNVFEHIYSIVGELSETLAYRDPVFFIEWFHKVNHPIDNKKMSKAFIQIYAAAIKIFHQKGEDCSNYINILERCWHNRKTEKITAFDYNSIIKMYLSIGLYDKAKQELQEIYDENNEWHLKYHAQIQQGLGDFDEALKNIKKAIQIYDKNMKRDGKYRFAFLRDEAEILYKMKDPTYLDIMKQAIEKAPDEELKKEWEEILERWNKR